MNSLAIFQLIIGIGFDIGLALLLLNQDFVLLFVANMAHIFQIRLLFILWVLFLAKSIFAGSIGSKGLLDPVVSTDPNDVHFYLYPTRGNPDFNQEIILDNPASLASSLFQPGFKTVFITHGFRSNSSSEMAQLLKNSYLASGLNYNYILTDWGKLSTPIAPLTSALYSLVTLNVPTVANRLAEFITFLISNDVASLQQLHLIGHSLGSHISGLAGLYLQETYNGNRVARVTGLDPAGPLYYPPITCRNLVSSDAAFVDVIHTNMGVLGDTTQDGHVDFYPNGGVTQTGCALNDTGLPALDPSTVGVCSHRYSYKIYAASLSKNFYACPCPNFNPELAELLCSTSCTNPILLGVNCPSSASGQYYLTASNPP